MAIISKPVRSSSPSRILKHWTAWPAVPLTKLSMAESATRRATWSSSSKPRHHGVSGAGVGTTGIAGSPRMFTPHSIGDDSVAASYCSGSSARAISTTAPAAVAWPVATARSAERPNMCAVSSVTCPEKPAQNRQPFAASSSSSSPG